MSDTSTSPATDQATGWPAEAPQGGAEEAGGRAASAEGGGWPGEETEEEFAAKQGEGQGAETPFADAELDENGVATPAACRQAMKAVMDPEIGINVVDLGLVYDIEVNDGTAYMRMTLTSMGCPLTELIHTQATLVLTRLPGIEEADVEFVFSPPWSTDMISEEAREELRAMGFNV